MHFLIVGHHPIVVLFFLCVHTLIWYAVLSFLVFILFFLLKEKNILVNITSSHANVIWCVDFTRVTIATPHWSTKLEYKKKFPSFILIRLWSSEGMSIPAKMLCAKQCGDWLRMLKLELAAHDIPIKNTYWKWVLTFCLTSLFVKKKKKCVVAVKRPLLCFPSRQNLCL